MFDHKPVRTRRSYSRAFKLQVLAETREPFVSVAEVARRHGMNANVIFNWLRDPRFGGSSAVTGFLPVKIDPAPVAVTAQPLSGPGDEVIVELAAGARIRCRDEPSLVKVLRALRQVT